jgi:nucleotide-binding universal stress UspA family protein
MHALALTNSPAPPVRSTPIAAQARARIFVAVDRSAASRAAATTAIDLARAFGCSVLFVYARRRPSSIWGSPFYQRRLSRETRRARSTLDVVLRLALDAGVEADAEIVDGPARKGVVDFAAARGATLIIGAGRRRPPGSAAVSVVDREAVSSTGRTR